jgi:hypothetical protein
LYIDDFRACKCLYTHPEDFHTDPKAGVSNSDNGSDQYPAEDTLDDSLLANPEAFARRRLYEDFTYIGLLDNLGNREIDQLYDWPARVGQYSSVSEVWDQIKA